MTVTEVNLEQFIIYPYLGAATLKQTHHIVIDSFPPFHGMQYDVTVDEIVDIPE